MFLERLKKIGSLLFILLVIAASVFAQNTSNKGRDFWLGYGNHVRGYGNNTQSMVVYVTSDVSTSGKVEIPGIGFSRTFSVTANSITTVDIPQSAYLVDAGLYNLGIHITAERPVVVYAHIYDQNVSGATLVLPTAALGKEYYSINYTQLSNQPRSYSYFFVVAVEDNTQVQIIPSANAIGHPAGVPFVVSLRKGQVYQVLGSATPGNGNLFGGVDLTGSTIKSITTTAEPCKRIAVFSGSGKIAIGCGQDFTNSSDNLYQQVYPTSSWGKKFITAPLKARNYDIIRVFKSDAAAVVKVNGQIIGNTSFVNNLYYEFSTQTTNVVEADRPIQVVQYAVTQNRSINCFFSAEAAGDPEMIYLNSVEQNIDNITVYSSSAYLILNHYINVVIETSAAASFRIDGAPVNFTRVAADPTYSYAQISVNAGVHTLKADKGFNAIAYGFGSAESYGYSAGANVNSLGIELETRVKNIKTTDGCVNEPLRFKVNLPYQVSRLTWNLNDGNPAREVANPEPVSSYLENDLTYYIYELTDTIRYQQAKDYSIDVIAEKPLSGDCGSNEQLFFDFSIFNPPVPKFSTAVEVCAGDTLSFKDESNGQGRPITTWLWDFGDPASGDLNTSTEQNPVHVYPLGGTYPVTLTVTNESNCSPVIITQDVDVLNKPTSNFVNDANSCENLPMSFTDRSVINIGVINQWRWDFGDGQFSTEQNPVHTYTLPGSYEVTLSSRADKGCQSDPIKKVIVVNALPEVDFQIPEICLADAIAKFTDLSTISVGDLSNASFRWNFGDQNANAQRPNTSTLRNPEHVYTATGTYQVTLTVFAAGGCETTISKSLTVNGSIPKANFAVVNKEKLCSQSPVVFEDRATVDFGELTRIEWYFDVVNEPGAKLVDDNPNKRADPAKRYEFQYPAFGDPAEKLYTVKMLAYSGEVCVNEQIQEIVLKAEPEIKFDPVAAVCIDAPAFQITQAAVLNNIPGQGRFSGKGVSAEGLFNPSVAGGGSHEIIYTFAGSNGCVAVQSQIVTVTLLPVANAGNDQVVLEGGSVELAAEASGTDLTYKWTPSTGLNRDDILNPLASPVDDIVYTLTITSGIGCITVDEVEVKVLKTPVVPNTFTPNNDGINDVWNIKYLESYPDVAIEVFNRYGNIIYSTIGYTIPWNGKFNGADLPVGTYFYVINPKNGRKTLSGSVTILR